MQLLSNQIINGRPCFREFGDLQRLKRPEGPTFGGNDEVLGVVRRGLALFWPVSTRLYPSRQVLDLLRRQLPGGRHLESGVCMSHGPDQQAFLGITWKNGWAGVTTL